MRVEGSDRKVERPNPTQDYTNKGVDLAKKSGDCRRALLTISESLRSMCNEANGKLILFN